MIKILKIRFSRIKLAKNPLMLAAILAICMGCLISAKLMPDENQNIGVRLGAEGKLVYSSDKLGNRIPDFSYCGYRASNEEIPFVQVKLVVSNIKGDATAKIQAAIDYIASLPLDENGFRGAILLESGTYKLNDRLVIRKSGIVLRGSGAVQNGTKLVAAGLNRETLIRIYGACVDSTMDEFEIIDEYVPVNATKIRVKKPAAFQKGQSVFIRRPSTKEWIDLLQMNEFGGETAWLGWKPGERDIVWDRKIVDIKDDTLILDAPITTALDKKYGISTVYSYYWPSRITNIGIENLSIESEFDSRNLKDEEHCWMGITMENARDCWVRQVNFSHLAGSAVAVYENSSRITVEDCASFEPVSEVAGWRRNTFFTAGQQTLFHNLHAEYGVHDFATGFCAAGPNAFVQCESILPSGFSGCIDSWASGVLFDIVSVDGNAICFSNRGQDGYGAGWTAANSMIWESNAARIECFSPPGAVNFAYGAWAQFAGNGNWVSCNEHVRPRSLYYAQLAERIGRKNVPDNPVIEIKTDPTSAPTVELANELTRILRNPAMTVKEWVEAASERNPISIDPGNAPDFDQLKIPVSKPEIKAKNGNLLVINGWLTRDGQLVTGNRFSVPWWSGNIRPRGINRAQPALTRYVPGRHGTGYTDDLEDVVHWMKARNMLGVEQNYALWYERRRDDHERVRRMDADAWAPFYEVPFARTGIGTAWDGMSKYDLTSYNPWYWNRLRQFADLADENGLILVHQNYFQHNIIEAGAHWVDFAWRSANNINNTGFPEPPSYAGDKRVFMAEHFYDLSNPVRKELHWKYIRKCLDNFADNGSVIQLISAEYTGPLHFVQFWIDVILEWEKETGKDALIGLSTTKDVQDAILEDPVRSKTIDLIDIHYWTSRDDGSLYAPKGGQNLAPRQHARLEKIGKRSFDQVYNDVLSYRTKFPGKAVCYSFDMSANWGWPVFMAGGSMANIPKINVLGFTKNAATMKTAQNSGNGIYQLQNERGESITYFDASREQKLKMPAGVYKKVMIDPVSGEQVGRDEEISGGKEIIISSDVNRPIIVWISKK